MNQRKPTAPEEEPQYTAIERVAAMFIHAWRTGERTGIKEFDEAASCEQASRFLIRVMRTETGAD